MASFLFWNLNRKPLAALLRLLVNTHTPDVLILAECRISVADLLGALNADSLYTYHVIQDRLQGLTQPDFPRLMLLSRLPKTAVKSVAGGIAEAVIFRIKPVGEDDFLLVAAHLPSKLHHDKSSQMLLAARLPSLIEKAELRVKHQRTVVIGDLNMDPFEEGMTSSETFHAVMDRQVALKMSRTVQGKQRRFFYNPMWSRLGDGTSGPSGTYYRPASGPLANYWYTFDQVLIRPDLLRNFKEENLRVLTEAGNVSLLTEGKVPDKAVASDHLPLFFQI